MKSHFPTRFLCSTALVLGLAITASLSHSHADWPSFRGDPRQSGVAEALPDRLELLWKVKLKDGIESTAAIVKGVIYVGAFDDHLHAFDLRSGQEKWSYKAGPIKAPVSVFDGRAYVGNLDGLFHCVDATTGKKIWTFETMAEITSGATMSPHGILFGSGDEHVYCLDRDGKERWKFRVPGGPVMGTPAVVGDRTFAAGCDSSLHVIDLKSGKEIGQGLNLNGQVGATVAVDDQFLFVGTISGEVMGINWKTTEMIWKFSSTTRQQPFHASAAVNDTLVVTAGRDKYVYALDRKTGKETWSFLTGHKVDSSPVIAGSRVYAGSLDGILYVLDLTRGNEIARFDLGHKILASPAVAGGCLVIGTEDGTLHCFGSKKSRAARATTP